MNETQRDHGAADEARTRVLALFTSRGKNVADDARNFDALLRDAFASDFNWQRRTLVAAAQEGVPARLKHASVGATGRNLLVSQIAEQLHTNAAIEPNAARWAVETLAAAIFGEPLYAILPPPAAAPAPAVIPDREAHAPEREIPDRTRVMAPLVEHRPPPPTEVTAPNRGYVMPLVVIGAVVATLIGGVAWKLQPQPRATPTPTTAAETTTAPRTAPPGPRLTTVPRLPPPAPASLPNNRYDASVALINGLAERQFAGSTSDFAGYPGGVYANNARFRGGVAPTIEALQKTEAGIANPWIAGLGGTPRSSNELLGFGDRRYVLFDSCSPNGCAHARLYGFYETTTGDAGAVLWDARAIEHNGDTYVATGATAYAMLDVLRVRRGNFPATAKQRAVMTQSLAVIEKPKEPPTTAPRTYPNTNTNTNTTANVPPPATSMRGRVIALIDDLENVDPGSSIFAGSAGGVYARSSDFRNGVGPLLTALEAKPVGQANSWIDGLGGQNKTNEILAAGSRRYVVFDTCSPNGCTQARLYGFYETTTGGAGAVLWDPQMGGDWITTTDANGKVMLDVLRVRLNNTTFPIRNAATRSKMIHLLDKIEL